MIPGIMESYFITIESAPVEETPKPQDCPDTSSSLNNTAVDYLKTSYYFDKALPYYNYNVTVYATDDAGDSQNAYASKTSKQAGKILFCFLHIVLFIICRTFQCNQCLFERCLEFGNRP